MVTKGKKRSKTVNFNSKDRASRVSMAFCPMSTDSLLLRPGETESRNPDRVGVGERVGEQET